MEKIPNESLENIMKEIEEASEKYTKELLSTEHGKKFLAQLDEKIVTNLGLAPKTSKDVAPEGENSEFDKKIMSDGSKKRKGRRMTCNEMRNIFK
jgi:hypothetical protein